MEFNDASRVTYWLGNILTNLLHQVPRGEITEVQLSPYFNRVAAGQPVHTLKEL